MDCNWMAQPPFSQLSQGQGHEMVFNPSTCDPTPIPLQDTLDSQDNGAYNYSSVLKPLFATTPSTSESMGSFSNSQSAPSQSAPSHGSQRAWSSVESFPSIASNGPTLEQYRALSSQLNETRRENTELMKHNQVLNAKLDTLAKAYEMLANRIPQLLGTRTTQQETRERNPNVKYWTRQEWIAANADRVADLDSGANAGGRGRTRAAKGINVNMKYLEDREGNPVNGHLASDIRRHARSIFVGLAQDGHSFKSWTEADHNSLKIYYREMAERFEELRLCANDWKAEMIALDIYGTWRDQWQKKKKKKADNDAKDENFEDDKDNSDDSDDEVSLKHGIDRTPSEDQRATKKVKSSSTPDPAPALLGHAVPTAVDLKLLQTHNIPSINVIPGTPAQVNTGKMVLNCQSSLQPMPPFQQSFNIINPLQLSSNATSTISPFTAMPPGVQASLQPAPNVPTFVAFNPALNNARLQPTPANKSQRMRPTKSITARNLCAIDWCKENKGTADDFNKFWNDLLKEEKEKYEALSKERSEQEKVST